MGVLIAGCYGRIYEIDMELVRNYFQLFSKEDLLDEWLNEIIR